MGTPRRIPQGRRGRSRFKLGHTTSGATRHQWRASVPSPMRVITVGRSHPRPACRSPGPTPPPPTGGTSTRCSPTRALAFHYHTILADGVERRSKLEYTPCDRAVGSRLLPQVTGSSASWTPPEPRAPTTSGRLRSCLRPELPPSSSPPRLRPDPAPPDGPTSSPPSSQPGRGTRRTRDPSRESVAVSIEVSPPVGYGAVGHTREAGGGTESHSSTGRCTSRRGEAAPPGIAWQTVRARSRR
jgi:hypothetical protein